MSLKNKIVLFVVANKDFRDEELIEPRRILENNSVRTVIASKKIGACLGKFGARAQASVSIDNIDVSIYDAVIFVGGPGSHDFWDDSNVLNLAKTADIKGKIICSICSATGIIANAKIIRGKKVTGWPDTEELVKKAGSIFSNYDIITSGRIITARGPSSARKFGEEILEALKNIS